jgi:H+-transporting ATPase
VVTGISMGKNFLSTEKAKKTDINVLLNELSANKGGLSVFEAKNRLQKYGFNELPEKKVNPIIKFARYFWGPIPWMIEAAVVMSAIIQRWEDFGIFLHCYS